MFVPVPPKPDQPPPAQPAEPLQDEADEAADTDTPPDEDDAAAELDIPALRRPTTWPAIVRWARLCRVLAFVSLVICGILAARSLYLIVATEPQFVPFMEPILPITYFWYALMWAGAGVVSCISLLGFAELLHVLLAIEAASHVRRIAAEAPERDEV